MELILHLFPILLPPTGRGHCCASPTWQRSLLVRVYRSRRESLTSTISLSRMQRYQPHIRSDRFFLVFRNRDCSNLMLFKQLPETNPRKCTRDITVRCWVSPTKPDTWVVSRSSKSYKNTVTYLARNYLKQNNKCSFSLQVFRICRSLSANLPAVSSTERLFAPETLQTPPPS